MLVQVTIDSEVRVRLLQVIGSIGQQPGHGQPVAEQPVPGHVGAWMVLATRSASRIVGGSRCIGLGRLGVLGRGQPEAP